MARPRAIVLRAPGTNCDEETADAWQRAGAAVETWHVNRLIESPARPRSLPDPDDSRRLLLWRRPGRRPDPGHAARDRAGRRAAPVSRPRRAGSGHLQRVPGPGAERPVARRTVPVPGDAGSQRLGAFRGPLGEALAPARPLAVRVVLRADRAARRSRRGQVLDGRPRASGPPRRKRPDRLCVRRSERAGRPRSIPPIPTARRGGVAGRLRPDGPHLRPDAPSRTIYRFLAAPALDPKRADTFIRRGRDSNLSKRRRIIARLNSTAELLL